LPFAAAVTAPPLRVRTRPKPNPTNAPFSAIKFFVQVLMMLSVSDLLFA
jgi:hypothetical protein